MRIQLGQGAQTSAKREVVWHLKLTVHHFPLSLTLCKQGRKAEERNNWLALCSRTHQEAPSK